MGTLYESIVSLCDEIGIKPGKMCNDLGISRGLITDLKMGRKNSINIETAQKISSYFCVPVDYLLGLDPSKIQLHNSRRVFSVMNEQKIALDDLSREIGLPVETIRSFALGFGIANERDCLERLETRLQTPAGYLMGWTSNRDDYDFYDSITPDEWAQANNNPQRALFLHQTKNFNETSPSEFNKTKKPVLKLDELDENTMAIVEMLMDMSTEELILLKKRIEKIKESR